MDEEDNEFSIWGRSEYYSEEEIINNFDNFTFNFEGNFEKVVKELEKFIKKN